MSFCGTVASSTLSRWWERRGKCTKSEEWVSNLFGGGENNAKSIPEVREIYGMMHFAFIRGTFWFYYRYTLIAVSANDISFRSNVNQPFTNDFRVCWVISLILIYWVNFVSIGSFCRISPLPHQSHESSKKDFVWRRRKRHIVQVSQPERSGFRV